MAVQRAPLFHYPQASLFEQLMTLVHRESVGEQVAGHHSDRPQTREIVDRHICEDECPSWAQNPTNLVQCLGLIGPVMEAERGSDDVEALTREWQCLGSSPDEVESSSGLASGSQHPSRSVDAVECQPRPSLSQAVEQAPRAGTDVEKAARAEPAGESGRNCSLDRAEEQDLRRGTVVGPGPDVEVQVGISRMV